MSICKLLSTMFWRFEHFMLWNKKKELKDMPVNVYLVPLHIFFCIFIYVLVTQYCMIIGEYLVKQTCSNCRSTYVYFLSHLSHSGIQLQLVVLCALSILHFQLLKNCQTNCYHFWCESSVW